MKVKRSCVQFCFMRVKNHYVSFCFNENWQPTFCHLLCVWFTQLHYFLSQNIEHFFLLTAITKFGSQTSKLFFSETWKPTLCEFLFTGIESECLVILNPCLLYPVAVHLKLKFRRLVLRLCGPDRLLVRSFKFLIMAGLIVRTATNKQAYKQTNKQTPFHKTYCYGKKIFVILIIFVISWCTYDDRLQLHITRPQKPLLAPVNSVTWYTATKTWCMSQSEFHEYNVTIILDSFGNLLCKFFVPWSMCNQELHFWISFNNLMIVVNMGVDPISSLSA